MPPTDRRFPSHPTAAALACLMALANLPAVAQPAAATAPPASAEARSFAIPAGPLGGALDRFARTAGVNLSYEPALVAGLATPGLSGTMPVAAALARLLSGTGLEALAQPGGGYSLRRAAAAAAPAGVEGATTLPAVRVTAAPTSTLPCSRVRSSQAPSTPRCSTARNMSWRSTTAVRVATI